MKRLGLLFALLALAAVQNLAAEAAPARKGPVPNSVCADCHEVEAKLGKSAHAKVACATCHLKHEEYPHPEKQPKPQCVTCHEGAVREYEMSEHSQQIRKGNGAAPECSTCHGATHEVTVALTDSFRRSVPETCGMCHEKETQHFQKSVHGKAVLAGIQGAPVCTDCHGGHRILRAKDPRSTVFAASVPDTCGRCHGDLRLMKRFGLPSDRITSFD
ncbi:MAG: hypothetical protein HY821_20255, partial [Acidobacteria bacterium]|nr:hypothetical protein [Acidobacteriota bacterium]